MEMVVGTEQENSEGEQLRNFPQIATGERFIAFKQTVKQLYVLWRAAHFGINHEYNYHVVVLCFC